MRIFEIAVTVDCVVFRKLSTITEIALINRKNEPFKGSWALPGGFVDLNEDIETAAIRELEEETGIVVQTMRQVHAFGKPGRDPRGHTISIAYSAVVTGDTKVCAADDAADARWFRVDELPTMAFDHKEIITFTRSKLNI